MNIGIITLIFLFITFVGFVSGIAMFVSGEGVRRNTAFIITCCVNTFFSVLNLITISPNDYSKLIFSCIVIFFALCGIVLRFLPSKTASLSPILVFVTMIISMVCIFK